MKSFMSKVGAFFKAAWDFVKNIPWTQPVKPLIAWSVLGGEFALSVMFMLIFWL